MGDPLRRLEGKDDRKLGRARIVDGINCTPYDIAHQRGYLHAIVYPGNYEDVKTCLSDVLDPLRRLEDKDDRKLSARIVDASTALLMTLPTKGVTCTLSSPLATTRMSKPASAMCWTP